MWESNIPKTREDDWCRIYSTWLQVLILINSKPKKSFILNGINILDIVLQTKLANSKGEVRRMIKNNGLRINNELVKDESKIIDQNNFDNENNMKISHGKKQHVILKII